MYYFIAISPGVVRLTGQPDKKVFAGDVVEVGKAYVEQIFATCPFLNFNYTDEQEEDKSPSVAEKEAKEKLIEETKLVETKKFEQGPTLEDPFTEEEGLKFPEENLVIDLPPNAKVTEAISYMEKLLSLDHIFLDKLKAVADMYPSNKRVQSLYEGAVQTEKLKKGKS
jgi:hypothetical protein